MPSPTPVANPFALMIDPQAVLASVAHSERLGRLHSRICRPLDKPLLGSTAEGEEASGATDGAAAADDSSEGDQAA